MNISALRVRNWGPFEEEEFLFLDGVNFFLGPNESGKTWIVRGLMVGLLGRDLLEAQGWIGNPERPMQISMDFSTSAGEHRLSRIFEGGEERLCLTRLQGEGEKKLSEIRGEIHRFMGKTMGAGSDEILALYGMSPLSLIQREGIQRVVHAYEGLGQGIGFIPPGDAAQRIREEWISNEGKAGQGRLRALKRLLLSHQKELGQLSGLREAFQEAVDKRQRLLKDRSQLEEKRIALEERKNASLRREAAQEQLRRWTERREELEEMVTSLGRAQVRLVDVETRLDALDRFKRANLEDLSNRLNELQKNTEFVSWRFSSYQEAMGKLEAEHDKLEEGAPGIVELAEDPHRMDALSHTLEDLATCRERLERVQKVLSLSDKQKVGRGFAGKLLGALSGKAEGEDLREVELRLLHDRQRLEGALELEMSGVSLEDPRAALRKAAEIMGRLEDMAARKRELEGVGAELSVRRDSLQKRKEELLDETGADSLEDLAKKMEEVRELRAEKSRWEDALREGIASKGLDTLREEADRAREREKRLAHEVGDLEDRSWGPEDETVLNGVSEGLESLVQEISSLGQRAADTRERLVRGESELGGRIEYLTQETVRLKLKRSGASIAVQVLDALEEEMRAQTIPVVERELEGKLSLLTQGRHTRLSLCSPWPSLTISRDQGSAWPVKRFGTGTLWAAAVAMKLTVCSLFDKKGLTPLVLDSPFQTLDEDRSKGLLNLLSQEAKNGRQILCFTAWEKVDSFPQGSVPGLGWKCKRLDV